MNMAQAVSTELEQMIREKLSSIEQIDIVLLLRANPEKNWTAVDISRAFGTPQESTAMRLFLLASKGLILFGGSGIPTYRYAGDGDSGALLDELSRVRSERPEALIGIAEGAAPDPVRSFADAFKVKR
jgi:hypothetical protein